MRKVIAAVTFIAWIFLRNLPDRESDAPFIATPVIELPAEPKPEQKPEVAPAVEPVKFEPRIVMHTGSNCPACDRWKAIELPRWRARGWRIDVPPPESQSARRVWPWFEISDADGTSFEVIGYMETDNFMTAKRKVLRR